ncbi:hypothetical protein L3Y34_001416 [Caenorhabditis briggsae]|uniref:Protein kinase domain-containing protein n=1 Tax=Caenorhabditis briggsae TaxID=6238 RepID=A0AAE9DBZ8_CAEBR|nr:hypothetical protein L3Y34_001416 [Caenorhabditis briggsae]
MGNVATRKRPGCHHTARSDENEEEEDGPARKRLRIAENHTENEYQKLAFKSRLQKLKNCRPHLKRRTYKVEEADPRPPLPRFIVDDYDNYEKPETANRKEFAIPWFEHLFLPEFPTRSVINEKSFILERQLGRGSFGVVYCASAIHDSERKFAIKMQEKREIISKRAVLQVKREASIQRLLPAHPFIARTYSTWQTRTHLYSLLQYPTGSTEATHHANLKFIDYSTPIGCSREFANLMDRMLAVSQTHRLCSFTVLHAHPFFRSINFSKLEQKDYTPASEIGNAEYDTYQQNDETLDDALFKENYDFDRFDYFNDRF